MKCSVLTLGKGTGPVGMFYSVVFPGGFGESAIQSSLNIVYVKL